MGGILVVITISQQKGQGSLISKQQQRTFDFFVSSVTVRVLNIVTEGNNFEKLRRN